MASRQPEPPWLLDYRRRLSGVKLELPDVEARLSRAQDAPVPSRPWLIVAGLGVGLALAAGGPRLAKLAASLTQAGHQVVNSPAESSGAIVYRGGDVVVVDAVRGLEFSLNPKTLSVRAVTRLPEKDLSGLTWRVGETLTTPEGGKRVDAWIDGSASPSRSWPVDFGPASLFWDGRSLWAAERETGRLYRYSLEGDSLSAIERYDLGAARPVGLAVVSGRVWIADARSRSLCSYRLDPERLARPGGCLPLADQLAPGEELSGLALDRTTIWIATRNPARIHRLDRPRLAPPAAWPSSSG